MTPTRPTRPTRPTHPTRQRKPPPTPTRSRIECCFVIVCGSGRIAPPTAHDDGSTVVRAARMAEVGS